MRRGTWAAPGLLVGVALVACSSGSSSPGGNGNTTCALDVTLSGAINASAGSNVGCGNGGGSTGATLDWITPGCIIKTQGPCFDLIIDLLSPVAAGQTGALPASDVRVTTNGADGGSESWETPGGACTVTIASNTSDPDSSGFFKNRYVITGQGDCSQPALPSPGSGVAGDVTIGAFTFTGFIDPP